MPASQSHCQMSNESARKILFPSICPLWLSTQAVEFDLVMGPIIRRPNKKQKVRLSVYYNLELLHNAKWFVVYHISSCPAAQRRQNSRYLQQTLITFISPKLFSFNEEFKKRISATPSSVKKCWNISSKRHFLSTICFRVVVRNVLKVGIRVGRLGGG